MLDRYPRDSKEDSAKHKVLIRVLVKGGCIFLFLLRFTKKKERKLEDWMIKNFIPQHERPHSLRATEQIWIHTQIMSEHGQF